MTLFCGAVSETVLWWYSGAALNEQFNLDNIVEYLVITAIPASILLYYLYLQQQIRAQDLVDMASNAAEKTTQAEEELEEKGKPYRDDKIFMYLWQRHYGTSQYDAGFITRFFDKKLADHIRYDKARINYFTLNKLFISLLFS